MAEDNLSEFSRPQMYLFGCTLKSDKKEFKVEVEDDDTDHQLSLKAVCLGAEAEDKFHTVEIEGVTYDGKTTRVPLAVLKPSVLPCLSLGGFEITPPVTFHLQSGSGPVYISGQHFINVKDSDDEEEEENNTSPVKRPSNLMSGKRPAPKKLKMDSGEDDDDDDDDDDDSDEDDSDDTDKDERVAKMKKSLPSPLKKTPEKKQKSTSKQNGSPGKPGGSAPRPQTKTVGGDRQKTQAGPSKAPPTVSEMKSHLALTAKKGSLPKTQQKFENFAKSTWNVSDHKVVKDLWFFMQTLKTDKK